MTITYKSRFLARAEIWYDNEPEQLRSVDWILYQQRSQPVAGTRTIEHWTYAIDLTQSCKQLLANLSKDTASKIRRARERDKIACKFLDPRDPAVMKDFEKMYNAFAALIGRAPLNHRRMESMAAAGALDLSAAIDPQGNVLVYHLNYFDSQRATALESPSLYRTLSESADRNLVGRANRYLTWAILLRYQEQGLKCFDFGGWYSGSTDHKRLGINRFKEGFGGKVVREYQCEQILTWKGWMVLRAAELFARMKSYLTKSVEPATCRQPELDHGRMPAPQF